MNKQIQKAGDRSTNIQTGDVHITQGISYAEAHQIALDVFRANFLSLSDRAAEIVLARVEEITDKFLEKLKEQNEKGIAQLQKIQIFNMLSLRSRKSMPERAIKRWETFW